MINTVLKYGFQLIGLVLLQGLVLNNISVFGVANTYFYVVFILFLPVEYNRNVVLFLAFALGLAIDLFASSWGLHASSCVFLAYTRPLLLRFLAPRDGYEFNATPGWGSMGFSWFITYASIMIFVHHFTVQMIEAFRISEFFSVLGRSAASTVFTLILVVLTQLFSFKSSKSA